MPTKKLHKKAGKLLELYRKKKLTLATAESCTGGLVATLITDIPGSSDVFEGGFVTYSNASKTKFIGVPEALIKAHGAVSKEVAEAMARGAVKATGADVAIAITGIAGPGGGTKQKPVGLVYIAAASKHYTDVLVIKNQFKGSRRSIRLKSADKALTIAKKLYVFF